MSIIEQIAIGTLILAPLWRTYDVARRQRPIVRRTRTGKHVVVRGTHCRECR